MNTTSAAVLVTLSAGLALLSLSDSWGVGVLGGLLVAAGALVLTRHFWREAEDRLKRESAALGRTVIAELESSHEMFESRITGLGSQLEEVARRSDAFARGVLEYVAQLELDAESDRKLVEKGLNSLERLSLSNRNDVLTQLSGVIGVYSVLRPAIPYPPFGGWAIGGDCAQRLVSLILRKRPRWVLEIGSGLSTILMSQTLELIGGDGHVISLEHEIEWLDRSRDLVSEFGLAHRTEVMHAPLVEMEIDGDFYTWYDLTQVVLPREVEVIFIDGPPKATGPMARYPAIPLLHDHLAIGGVVLMDDASRPDEKAAIERWQASYPYLSFLRHSDAKGTVEIIKGNE